MYVTLPPLHFPASIHACIDVGEEGRRLDLFRGGVLNEGCRLFMNDKKGTIECMLRSHFSLPPPPLPYIHTYVRWGGGRGRQRKKEQGYRHVGCLLNDRRGMYVE